MKPLEAWVDVARKRVDQIEVDGDLPKLQKIIADVNVRPNFSLPIDTVELSLITMFYHTLS